MFTYQGKTIEIEKKNGKVLTGKSEEGSSKNSFKIRGEDGDVEIVKLTDVKTYDQKFPRGGTLGIKARPNPTSAPVAGSRPVKAPVKRSSVAKVVMQEKEELFFPLPTETFHGLNRLTLLVVMRKIEDMFSNAAMSVDAYTDNGLFSVNGASIPFILSVTGKKLVKHLYSEKYVIEIPGCGIQVFYFGKCVEGMVANGVLEADEKGDITLSPQIRPRISPDKAKELFDVAIGRSNMPAIVEANEEIRGLEGLKDGNCLTCREKKIRYKTLGLCAACYAKKYRKDMKEQDASAVKAVEPEHQPEIKPATSVDPKNLAVAIALEEIGSALVKLGLALRS